MKKLLLMLSVLIMGGGIGVATAQNLTISGTVTDASNKAPIAFASVAVEGTSFGTTTDLDGKYTLTVPEGSTVSFSFIGYATQDIRVLPSQTEVNVSLAADVYALDAVVAVGYGTMKRSDVTGAVASISGEDLAVAPVATVDQAMQGLIAGVTVNSNSGQPGQAAEVRIRGVGTVNNSAPIYVVDGIITEDIGFLNAGDIESMEVLKDASSTAIYGSRGANGVIIITTKSGGEGRTNVSFDMYAGIQNITRQLDLMNSHELASTIVKINNVQSEMNTFNNKGFKDWLKMYRIGNTKYLPGVDAFDYENQNTNWQREVQNRNAVIQNYHISVDGGTEKVKYSLSAGYFDQQGTIKESFYNRLTLRANSTYQIAKWLKAGLNVSYITARARSLTNNANMSGILYQAIAMAPWDPTHYPAGTIANDGRDIGGQISASSNFKNIYNPFSQLETSHPKSSDERLLGNFYLEIKPLDWLTIKSSVSMNRYFTQSRTYTEKYYHSDKDKMDYNSVGASMWRSTEMFYENTITFAKKIKKHNFSVMIGQTTEDYNYYGVNAGGRELTLTDPYHWYVSQTTDGKSGGDTAGMSRRLSFLGRAFYSFDERYLVTVNFRADGSSKFPENTWGYFPSVAVAWRASQESFLKDNPILDNLKVRLSWGQIGNDKIGEGAFVQSIGGPGPLFYNYTFGPTDPNKGSQMAGLDGTGLLPGAAVLTYVNTGGRWEYTEQIDLGVDFGLWNNKFYGTFDAYTRDTHDMLLSVQTPSIVGNLFSAQANVGTVQNLGIELTLGHRNTIKDFTYDISANISFVRNRLTKLNGGERIYDGIRMCDEGMPLWSFYGYEYEGIYRSDAEAVSHQWGKDPINVTEHAGDARYKDQNGDGVINDDDRVALGNPFPWLTYGINISLSWKGIDLYMLFNGVYGNKIYNALRLTTEGNGEGNLSTRMRNVWTPSTPNGNIPNPNGSANNNVTSSRFVEDGAYFRLKDIQLGYTLPQHITRKFGVSRWRIYVSASNVFTATKYTGYDPEVGGGVDWGNYPQSTNVLFGTNINF